MVPSRNTVATISLLGANITLLRQKWVGQAIPEDELKMSLVLHAHTLLVVSEAAKARCCLGGPKFRIKKHNLAYIWNIGLSDDTFLKITSTAPQSSARQQPGSQLTPPDQCDEFEYLAWLLCMCGHFITWSHVRLKNYKVNVSLSLILTPQGDILIFGRSRHMCIIIVWVSTYMSTYKSYF